MFAKKSSLNNLQIKTFSSLLIDLGKLFFAGGVITFIFPGITDKTNPIGFIVGLAASITLFAVAIRLLRVEKKYD